MTGQVEEVSTKQEPEMNIGYVEEEEIEFGTVVERG